MIEKMVSEGRIQMDILSLQKKSGAQKSAAGNVSLKP